MEKVIEFNHVSFAYENQNVLENIHFSICHQDFLGVIGPNGGGKTTLLKLILGLLKPTQGMVRIFNAPPEKMCTRLGYVPQYSETDKNFPITVKEVVAMSVAAGQPFFPWIQSKYLQAAEQAMEIVKITDLADKTFGELSGGQRQRCLIARALASQPDILLLDEPTASVDPSVEEDLYELLKQLNQQMTIILVSHDLGFISAYVKQVACINRHLILHKIEEVSQETVIRDAYYGRISMIHHECKI